MPVPLPASETLNREFLEIRARILEIAAALDRLDRSEGSVEPDPRIDRIRRGLTVLSGSDGDKAEQIQMVFSLPYEQDWQTRLSVGRRF